MLALWACTAWSDVPRTIERVKGSVLPIGTYEAARSPQFVFLGTGFVVGDGRIVATNAHVVPPVLDAERRESIVVVLPTPQGDGRFQFRGLKTLATDESTDLALLKLEGEPMTALRLLDSDSVREGQEVLLTGYPIGAVLGPYPATHRGMVSAITPIAIPQARATALDPHVVRRLAAGSLPVFQLDATVYPGNSGSPVYDPQSGEVMGIVNMVLVKSTKESVLKDPSGIAYAIPAKHLKALLEKVH
ncbi:MAG TPA: serine protease [Casimicrobiaceae bacterium]|nr:serine protease [Casimicrobiaceae bacterium]